MDKKKRYSKIFLIIEIAVLILIVFFVIKTIYNLKSYPDAELSGGDSNVQEDASQESDTTESQISVTDGSKNDASIAVAATSTEEPSTTSIPVTVTPSFITDSSNIAAGSVITDGYFDWSNTNQYFISQEIVEGDAVYQRIIEKSYRVNDDIGLSDLRYLKVVHYNFDGQIQVGEIIVNARLADDFLGIFKELFASKYQIRQMHLVDDYWTGDGDTTDTASIEVDNTSAFNYRRATGSSHLSQHAYGCAIDLNPMENPYVVFDDDGNVSTHHDNAQQYKENRTAAEAHVITHEDIAFMIFQKYGFTWGGDWNNPKDYQHFQKELG